MNLDEYAERVAINEATIRETRISTLLRPKPWWLPTHVWHRIIKRLIVIQEETR